VTPEKIRAIEESIVFKERAEHRGTSSRSIARAALLVERLALRERLRGIPLLGVVGSKGKGTAAIFASAALASAGLKVGTVLSPGVISNIDRFRVDGRKPSEEDYLGVLAKLDETIDALDPVDPADGYLSPGGLFMLGGLDFLATAGCDVIVVEAGIGGASDELSLFDLDTVVVTGIFGEHLELLGPTVVDVAKNKSAVITAATRHAFTLTQTPEVQAVIAAQSLKVGAELTVVDPVLSIDDRRLFPPGFSGRNAELGTVAGLSLAEAIIGTRPSEKTIVATIGSVVYPGRLSVHETEAGRVVVDSAVSRDGLVSALLFAELTFERKPEQVLVSLPRDKDLVGFIAELKDVDVRRVFVDLDTQLKYPDRSEWPWDWVDVADLPALLGSGDTLAIGTVSFSAEVLRVLEVDTDVLFSAPPAG
jgi:dihydrofolate synthase / folylpolyglutamate synthase